ncbi:hypothetical protein G3M48_008372 [Beauveria asiatica]|uniref:Protein kinase domain-containing protein n=1 Tax=Beauveria asiatica TaxID=1069075 RepID=A0AAW0RKH9_9HYPO
MDLTHRLFSLRPKNKAAEVIRKQNLDIASDMMMEVALDFGHFQSKTTDKNNGCIATIGCHPDADIAIPGDGTTVFDLRLEFWVLDNAYVKFVDKSSNVSCRVYGGENGDRNFLCVNCRQALSSDRLCRIEFQIGESEWADFDIIWQYRPSLASALEARRNAVLPRRQPQYAVATRSTAIARYSWSSRPLGSGKFGVVYRVKDQATNQLYAVKVQPGSNEVRREIETLKNIRRHPNVVRFHGTNCSYGYECFKYELNKGPPGVHIFMDLMEGSLHDMVYTKMRPMQLNDHALAIQVYHDVLKGLDYIHSKGFIHRDLKPANILWTLRDGQPSFCIADFGVSNAQSLAKSLCGTPMFLAPEYEFRCPQTPAVDLWALLITIFWTANFYGFRDITWKSNEQRLLWVAELAQRRWNDLGRVQELVVLDPKDRATASQMLVKVFDGNGLTTKRSDVPELPTVCAPEIKRPREGMPIEEMTPGNHIFTRLAEWPDNKGNAQVVNEQFGSGGGIIAAPVRRTRKPGGKGSIDCPRRPVAIAGQPLVTMQRAPETKRLVIRKAVAVAGQHRVTKQRAPATKRLGIRKKFARGIRSQAKRRSTAGAWFRHFTADPWVLSRFASPERR